MSRQARNSLKLEKDVPALCFSWKARSSSSSSFLSFLAALRGLTLPPDKRFSAGTVMIQVAVSRPTFSACTAHCDVCRVCFDLGSIWTCLRGDRERNEKSEQKRWPAGAQGGAGACITNRVSAIFASHPVTGLKELSSATPGNFSHQHPIYRRELFRPHRAFEFTCSVSTGSEEQTRSRRFTHLVGLLKSLRTRFWKHSC